MSKQESESKTKIIPFRALKKAAGGSGGSSSGGGGYRPGQIVNCKVIAKEPGGYHVIDCENGHPGFLVYEQIRKEGEVVRTVFVTLDNKRILLSELIPDALK